MAKYKYKALENNTKIVEGEVEAQSLREARELIRKLGFIPTKVYTEYAPQTQVQIVTKQEKSTAKVPIKHLSLAQKINFTSQLETLLSAGIPILEALQTIENNSPDVNYQSKS